MSGLRTLRHSGRELPGCLRISKGLKTAFLDIQGRPGAAQEEVLVLLRSVFGT